MLKAVEAKLFRCQQEAEISSDRAKIKEKNHSGDNEVALKIES
jgi:hypothetical protein